MIDNNTKIAERGIKAALFQAVYLRVSGAGAFLDSKEDKTPVILLDMAGPLYLIFSSMVTDKSGLQYGNLSKEEFLNVFAELSGDSNRSDTGTISRHLDFYSTAHQQVNDLDLYQIIFEKLKQEGFEYIHIDILPRRKDKPDAARINRLVESLKKLSADEDFKSGYIDEYILLNKIDLSGIQHKLQEQLLFEELQDIDSCKLLMSYYKVYQKLPEGYL